MIKKYIAGIILCMMTTGPIAATKPEKKILPTSKKYFATMNYITKQPTEVSKKNNEKYLMIGTIAGLILGALTGLLIFGRKKKYRKKPCIYKHESYLDDILGFAIKHK